MEERASGIILRTRPFTETSLIIEWLTEGLGRIATVAKGARRAKSPFLGKLDLFYAAEFSFVRSRKPDLHTLREVQLKNAHARLREELAWVHQASYFAVFVERGTEKETPIPEIYNLFTSAVETLEGSRLSPRILFAFELKMLTLLGYEPNLSELEVEARILARDLAEGAFSAIVKKPSLKAYNELNRFLWNSISAVLDFMPPQREKAQLALMPGYKG